MTFIITKLCRDKLDLSCVEACPVDCIYQYTGDDPSIPKNQLLIDPDECIDCDACVPSCPWEAIFSEDLLPDVFAEDLEINARIVDQDREVPEKLEDMPAPSPDEVEENKTKWGYE